MFSITKIIDSFVDANLNYLIREVIGFIGVSDSIAPQVRNHLIEVDSRFRLALLFLSILIFPEKFLQDFLKHRSHSRTITALKKLPLVKSLLQLIHTISMMIAIREKY